ncbi:hypothetical protein CRG98_031345 [Punica granatum]|uniref:Transposase-associated domain-containing protein n=1 Tax=Punica granatum TaxID=22663 RepID=A0A2I0IW64_PUNGR|nr:hypothetical protein CRG98_031345 [Punica granatum]
MAPLGQPTPPWGRLSEASGVSNEGFESKARRKSKTGIGRINREREGELGGSKPPFPATSRDRKGEQCRIPTPLSSDLLPCTRSPEAPETFGDLALGEIDDPKGMSWMYKRTYPDGRTRGIRPKLVAGVKTFLDYACGSTKFGRGKFRCPCTKCLYSGAVLMRGVVQLHLLQWGFRPDCWSWIEHGEDRPVEEPRKVFEYGGASADDMVQLQGLAQGRPPLPFAAIDGNDDVPNIPSTDASNHQQGNNDHQGGDDVDVGN